MRLLGRGKRKASEWWNESISELSKGIGKHDCLLQDRTYSNEGEMYENQLCCEFGNKKPGEKSI